MKKMILLIVVFILLGSGCAVPSASDISRGSSRFGWVVTPETSVENFQSKGGWVRLSSGVFVWGNIEKESKATYDWSQADQEVQKWQAQDQALLITLSAFAQWDQESCHGKMPQQPLLSICYVEGYENWVRAIVERYDADGENDMPNLKYAITHFSIENGDNYQTTPFAYAEMFRLAHDVIKTINPESVVLLGAVSDLSEDSRRYWRAFLQTEPTRGDVATLHSLSASNDFLTKSFREFLNQYGYHKRPLWITAARVDTGDPTSDQDQIERLTFVNYVSAFANGAEKIFSADEQTTTVYPLMKELIGYWRTLERLDDHAVRFDVVDHAVYALWGGAVLPKSVTGRVDVIQIDGTRSRMKAKDVKADVPLFVVVE